MNLCIPTVVNRRKNPCGHHESLMILILLCDDKQKLIYDKTQLMVPINILTSST